VIVIVAPIDTAKSLQRFDLGRNRERPPTGDDVARSR
jgi:hypothetical protein